MELSRDLMARQEARELLSRAEKAQQIYQAFPQEKVDEICRAAARAFEAQAEMLARLAVEETGFGTQESKREKNLFACRKVLSAMEGMKTRGILRKTPGLWEIGVPVGVIAAIVPSTNPTSTVCYKALIALKSGNAIVFSPHPKADTAERYLPVPT